MSTRLQTHNTFLSFSSSKYYCYYYYYYYYSYYYFYYSYYYYYYFFVCLVALFDRAFGASEIAQKVHRKPSRLITQIDLRPDYQFVYEEPQSARPHHYACTSM
ncbi:unnamed protein product [Protopolystoma xenopodis]|uniref:Uncharacterized protein n=1 Tax=Protopolystoma xenopodis TaxID=117903 RepID=A0A3S5AU85_9PLAT|nr:unnamed protein product [Protopolystoma xenopodis]